MRKASSMPRTERGSVVVLLCIERSVRELANDRGVRRLGKWKNESVVIERSAANLWNC